MPTAYAVTISLPTATVTALKRGGYSLYGYMAVRAGQADGLPLVWFRLPAGEFFPTTRAAWTSGYRAFVSPDKLAPGRPIEAGTSVPIEPGQVAILSQGGGLAVRSGQAGMISVSNSTEVPYTWGISQSVRGAFSPICGLPLYGRGEDSVSPVEKVLLDFSTMSVAPGTALEYLQASPTSALVAYSQGILIDLTGVTGRSVAFDIDEGWSWGGYTWARGVPPGADLVATLMGPDSSP